MKTTCSSCGAAGNIPEGKLPAAGANIRCPSCSHVFFVAREPVASPSGDALVEASLSAGSTAERAPEQVVPSSTTTAPPSSSLKPRAVSASRPSPYGTSRPGSISVEALAIGLPRDETTGPPEADVLSSFRDQNTIPTPALSEDTADRLVAGYAQSGSGNQDAVTMPQARTIEPSPSLKSAVDRAAQSVSGERDAEEALALIRMASTARAAWRVRDALGMVYDFPELSALRTWLGTRSSHEGIQVSSDETSDWVEVSRARELQGLEPSGMRSARPSGVSRMTRTAATVIPAAQSGQGARTFSGAHESAAALADRVESDKKPSAPSGREKRAALQSRRSAAREMETQAKSGSVRRSERAATRGKEASAEKAKTAALQRTIMLGSALIFVVLVGVYAFTRPSVVRIPATPAGIEAQWALDALNDSSRAGVGNVQQRFEELALREASAETVSAWFAFQDAEVPEFILQRIERERGETEIALELMSTFGGRYLLTVV
ncbi:MAG: putative Zn finger-like uncharacterized protein, partial [Flavobacteriales bacterium]